MTESGKIDKHLDHEAKFLKELIKLGSAQSFSCFRCRAEKKSKLRAIWHTPEGEKIICNGCYGFLLSEAINEPIR